MKLPADLEPRRGALVHAFDIAPTPTAWPDEKPGFIWAEQPEQLARVLISVYHPLVTGARIAYLFRESMKEGDWIKYGVAGKAPAKVRFLADYDLTIEFNWEAWRTLSYEQRIALVDHELSHFGYDADKDGYTIVHHDVEEFRSIVKRWGLWQLELQRFGQTVHEALNQTELFAGASEQS